QHLGARQKPDDFAVRPHRPVLEFDGRVALESALDRKAERIAIIRMDERIETFESKRNLPGLDAVDAVEGIRPRDPVGEKVPVPDAELSGLGRQPEALVAVAEGLRAARFCVLRGRFFPRAKVAATRRLGNRQTEGASGCARLTAARRL